MPCQNLTDLYRHQLQRLHQGELQLIEALEIFSIQSTQTDLKQAIHDHRQETLRHASAMEDLLQCWGIPLLPPPHPILTVLIQQAEETELNRRTPTSVRDAALLAAIQQIEHCEISAYGTVSAYAELLGHGNEVETLHTILTEEKAMNRRLTELAAEINGQADEALQKKVSYLPKTTGEQKFPEGSKLRPAPVFN